MTNSYRTLAIPASLWRRSEKYSGTIAVKPNRLPRKRSVSIQNWLKNWKTNAANLAVMIWSAGDAPARKARTYWKPE